MMVFAAIFSLVSCGDQTEPDVPPVTYDAPSITWEGHDFDTPMEITEEMNVVIDIDVPAGIKSFVVDIDSDVLNELRDFYNRFCQSGRCSAGNYSCSCSRRGAGYHNCDIPYAGALQSDTDDIES